LNAYQTTIKEFFVKPKPSLSKYIAEPLVYFGSPPLKEHSYKQADRKDIASKLGFKREHGPSNSIIPTKWICLTTHKGLSQTMFVVPMQKQQTFIQIKRRGKPLLEKLSPGEFSTYDNGWKAYTMAVGVLVIDEFHIVKNEKTQLWSTVRIMVEQSYCATTLCIMSGTPHMRGIQDLVAPINIWRDTWSGIIQQKDRFKDWPRASTTTITSMLAATDPAIIAKDKAAYNSFVAAAVNRQNISVKWSNLESAIEKWADALKPIYGRLLTTSKINGRVINPLPTLHLKPESIPIKRLKDKDRLNRIRTWIAKQKEKDQISPLNMSDVIDHLRDMMPITVYPFLVELRFNQDGRLFPKGWTWDHIIK